MIKNGINRIRSVLSVLIIGLLAIPMTASAADFQWPNNLKIATPAMGSSAYTLILGWANKMEAATGMKIRLLPEEAIGAKWASIKTGRFDMMNESSGTVGLFILPATIGYQTEKGGPFPVRSFWVMQMQSFVVFVRGDSPVKTVRDIAKQGKDFRVVHWTVPGGMEIIQAVLGWAGISVDDITLVKTGSYTGQVRMIAEGKADLGCLAIPTAPVFVEATASPHGIRVLDLNEEEDPKGAEAFREVLPVYSFPEVKDGPEQFRGLHGWGTATMLHTAASTDPDLIYNMVKWWDQNMDEIGHLHPSIGRYMTAEYNHQLFGEMFLPTHEGSVRYYKELGMWTAADQRRQEYLVKLVDMYSDGYQAAQAEARRKGIKIDPGNDEWTALWENYKKSRKFPVFRIMSDAEIEAALAKMD